MVIFHVFFLVKYGSSWPISFSTMIFFSPKLSLWPWAFPLGTNQFDPPNLKM